MSRDDVDFTTRIERCVPCRRSAASAFCTVIRSKLRRASASEEEEEEEGGERKLSERDKGWEGNDEGNDEDDEEEDEEEDEKDEDKGEEKGGEESDATECELSSPSPLPAVMGGNVSIIASIDESGSSGLKSLRYGKSEESTVRWEEKKASSDTAEEKGEEDEKLVVSVEER